MSEAAAAPAVEVKAPDVAPVEVAAPAVAAEPATGETPKEALVNQVEFYLSDSNLPFDKFLFTHWSNSFHNPDSAILATPVPADLTPSTVTPSRESKHAAFHLGWLLLSRITSFKRMQPFLEPAPAGFGSIGAIAAVLAESASAVEVRHFGDDASSDEGWYIRKTCDLSRPEDVQARSVYVKGFPVHEPSTDTPEEKIKIKEEDLALQVQLESWARALNVGPVKSVRMRREDSIPPPGAAKSIPMKGRGKFKGSVFIEFSSITNVNAFLALDPKPTFNGAPLEMMSKTDYVEMKRKIYAPDSKPNPASTIPKNPYPKSAKPFNAWADKLVGNHGFPAVIVPGERRTDDKKRKAGDEGSEEREILFDGVRFTAKRVGGEGGTVEIVDEEKVGRGEGEWPAGKVVRFVISKADGSFDGTPEAGPQFNFNDLKTQLIPICKPSFVSLLDNRTIAPLPAGADSKMAEAEAPKSDVPARLTAPPAIGTASAVKTEVAATVVARGEQTYPARGQTSFKEILTDAMFAELEKTLGEWEGRKVQWIRASAAEERTHIVSRARFHAEQSFSNVVGGRSNGGGRGGRGGRGGDRGGRGRGGGRGGRGGRGGDNKRPRRD